MRIWKKAAAIVLCLAALAAAGCAGERGPASGDGSAFSFDDASCVGKGYGSTTMSYPFEQPRDYVQIYAGDSEQAQQEFSYTVSGELTVTMSGSLSGLTNVCFRLYSTLFEEYEAGTRVQVEMRFRADPAMSSLMFLAYNDETGTEINDLNIPKTGEYADLEFTTSLETSAGFYRNNRNGGNEKNVMLMLARVGVDEVFSIDSVNFTFA